MNGLDWKAEPDLDRLRMLHAALAKSPPEALAGLEQLADRGSAASMLYLADYYMQTGSTSRIEIEKAKYWYNKAHENGCPQASYMLGRIQYESHEYDLAFAAFSTGAAKSYAPAVYRLAKMYQRGEGVKQDITEYKNLLEAARSRGHIFAKRDLAGLLLTGKFGVASMFRGAAMLIGMWSDVALLVGKALRPGSTFDERVLA